jgi:hypothetical protein
MASKASRGSHGHRVDYDRVLIAEMQALDIHLDRIEEARQAVDTRRPFFFSMLDSQLLAFCVNAVVRSARGRSTVGLFFRPGTCFLTTSFRYRLKRRLFHALSRLPNVHILTLMPFAACPGFSEVATAWIYDPQLWDLHYFGFPENATLPALRDALEAKARGRRILIALGEQNRDKGFEYLAELWCCSERLREKFLFVTAGNVAPESMQKMELFVQHGGLLLNRRISDDELMNMYGCAQIIWNCYSPAYDQASGIFGRAIQLGLPVVVREGSYLEQLGRILGHPTQALPFDQAVAAADRLMAWEPAVRDLAQRLALIAKMRAHSVSVLADHLRSKDPS